MVLKLYYSKKDTPSVHKCLTEYTKNSSPRLIINLNNQEIIYMFRIN